MMLMAEMVIGARDILCLRRLQKRLVATLVGAVANDEPVDTRVARLGARLWTRMVADGCVPARMLLVMLRMVLMVLGAPLLLLVVVAAA